MFKLTREDFERMQSRCLEMEVKDVPCLLRSEFPESDESSHGMPYFRFSIPVGGSESTLRLLFRINGRKDGKWMVQTYGDASVESVCELDGCLERVMRYEDGYSGQASSSSQMAFLAACNSKIRLVSAKGDGFHRKFKCEDARSAVLVADIFAHFLSLGIMDLCKGLEKYGRRGILEACDRMLSTDRAFAHGLKMEKGDTDGNHSDETRRQ